MNAQPEKTMNGNTQRISGPYSHDNLTLFLMHAPDAANTNRYTVLQTALARGAVVVHETGVVGQLTIENRMDDKDLFIQAGEILRGGRQDRTVGVDFVVPARATIPVPTFCVESARWHRRGQEDARRFTSSTNYIAMKKLKLATKLHANQGAVWEEVARAQAKLAFSVGADVHSPQSPSSFELSLDHEQLVRRRQAYTGHLQSLITDHPDAIGFAFAINGRLNSAESYPSHDLFAAFWPKLLGSAAVEAVAELRAPKQAQPVSTEEVRHGLADPRTAPAQTRRITDRVSLHTKRTSHTILFETHDSELPHASLHEQYIWDPQEVLPFPVVPVQT